MEEVMHPLLLPARGARVVADTDSHNCGWPCLRAVTRVPLPTPLGPVSTVSLGEAGAIGIGRGEA